MVKFTAQGEERVKAYIAELEAKRKEILDANKDTADCTFLPNIQTIACDVETFVDEDGDYYNGWAVTDNYNADRILVLTENDDFVIIKEAKDLHERAWNRIEAFNKTCKNGNLYDYYIFPMFGNEFEWLISRWLDKRITVSENANMFGLICDGELSFFNDIDAADEWINEIMFEDYYIYNAMLEELSEKYKT